MCHEKPQNWFSPRNLKGKFTQKTKLVWDERAKEDDMNTIDCL